MAGLRLNLSKSLRGCVNLSSKSQTFRLCDYHVNTSQCADEISVRPLFAHTNRDYGAKVPKSVGKGGSNTSVGVSNSKSLINVGCYASKPNGSPFGRAVPILSVCSFPRHYSVFSSPSSSGNDLKRADPGIQASSTASEVNVPGSGSGDDWLERAKDLWHNTVDAANHTGQKAKEASAELSPHVEKLLDTYPYLKDVVVPISVTFTGTLLAWFVLPRLLRRFHKYASQGQAALLPGSLAAEVSPYEKSFWGALEDPIRYLVTFMAFTQIGMMVAPTTIASQYLTPAWRSAIILSFVWFVHRWKSNVFARALAASSAAAGVEREKLLAIDKISSVGLFVIGMMALAEACGVAVQSILTVGGIGGVATAFASKDILGNVLSGLSMQFSRPFSIGDTIKAGTIEGQVVEMGLTTTSLLNAEKFPVIVPNSLFASQIIVNKSRAEWRAIINKIPLEINDLDKVPEIVIEVNNMLKSHANVFLGKEAPYCFLSRIDSLFAELTIGCNLKRMRKEELYLTQQDILLQSAQIIKRHGAKLGSTLQDSIA